MSRKDLNLIGQRYATSKCHTIADLDHSLQHLGYRGEALASTINCSGTVEIQSRYRLSQETYSKIFLHGTAMPVTLCPAQRPSVGTTITVHDFFYNLPVRRRLIKVDLELENIRQTLLCVALANPSISFSLRNDMIGECVLQTRRTNSVLASFSVLFGSSKASSMKELIFEHSIFRITGYISTECHHGKQLQFVYVNGRLVKKTALHLCVNNLIANSLIARSLSRQADARGCGLVADITSPRRTSEKHGMYVLMVKCPRTEYDVCLEPAKTLIEFRDWDVVLDCLTQVVRQFLVKYSLTLGPEYMGSEEGGEEGGEECQEGGREGREGHEAEGEGCEEGDEGYQEGDWEGRDGREEEGDGCEEEGEAGVARCSEHFCDPEATAPGGDGGASRDASSVREWVGITGNGMESVSAQEGSCSTGGVDSMFAGSEDGGVKMFAHGEDIRCTSTGLMGGASLDLTSGGLEQNCSGGLERNCSIRLDQTCGLEQVCSSRLEQNGLDVDGLEQSNSHDGSITLSHSKRTPNMVIDVRGSRPKEHGARKVGRTAAAVLRLDRPSRSPLNSRSTASKLAGFLRGEKPKLRTSRNAASASGEDTQVGRPVSTVSGQQRQDVGILANRTLPAGTAPAIANLRVTQHTVTASTGLDGQSTVLPDTASESLSHGQLTVVQQNLPLLSYVTATLSSVQERFPLNTLPITLSREQQPALPSNTQQSLPLNNSLPLNTLPRTLSREQQPAMPSNAQQSFPLNIPRTLSREQQPAMPSSTQQSLPLNTLPRTLSREQQPAMLSDTQQSLPLNTLPRTLSREQQPTILSSTQQCLPLNTLPITLSREHQPAMPSSTQQSLPLNTLPRTLSHEQQPAMPSNTQPLNTLPITLSREQQPAMPSSTQQSLPFPRTLNHVPSQESELQDANAASDIGDYGDTIPNCDGPVMQNTALSTRLSCEEQSLCDTAPTEASTKCQGSGVWDDTSGSMQPSDISEHFNPTRPQSAAALLPAPQISYPDCALCDLDGSIQPASVRAPSASGDFGWIASPVATDTCVSSTRFEHGVGGCVAAVDPDSCMWCSRFESSRRLLNLSSCECQVSRGSVPAINVSSSLSSSCFEHQHSRGSVPAINLSSSLSSLCFECQVSQHRVPVANLNTCEQADLAVPSYSDQESDVLRRVVSEPSETGSASLGEIWKEVYDPVTSKKVYIHSRTGNSHPSLPFRCTGSDSGLPGFTSTGLDSGGGGGGGGSNGNAEICMMSPSYGARPIAAAPHLSHDFDCFLPGAKRLKLDDSTGLDSRSHSNPSGDQLGNDVDQSQNEAWRAKEGTGPFESLLRNWKNPAFLPSQEVSRKRKTVAIPLVTSTTKLIHKMTLTHVFRRTHKISTGNSLTFSHCPNNQTK